MERQALVQEVSRRLGRRSLVWAGTRGDDVEPISDLPQLEHSFSIINAYSNRTSIESTSYEDLTGVRVDLESWDIDDNLEKPEAVAFRRGLLQSLAPASALLPYRASKFLSAAYFARRKRCINLGLFGAHQSAFDHKPWVETEIANLGLPCIPWTYVADDEQHGLRALLAKGPVVLRLSRTSGGAGIQRVETQSELTSRWPRADEAFVSVAPYIDPALPLNVGATVWHNGVTVHHPSVQLIGIPSCVTRPFGYCGNDFGLARDLLDPSMHNEIQEATTKIGKWLRGFGYLGTFGVDFLLHEGSLLFTEVNPRFQGSTHASSRLDIEAGQSCLLLEHIAAFLGVDAPSQRPLHEIVGESPALAHLVIHWTGPEARSLDPGPLVRGAAAISRGSRSDVLTHPSLLTLPGATAARITVRERVTTGGYDLLTPWAQLVEAWRAQMGVPSSQPASSIVTEGR